MWHWSGPTKDGDFVAQHEELDVLRRCSAPEQSDQAQHLLEDEV
jgi:hypothetical protein